MIEKETSKVPHPRRLAAGLALLTALAMAGCWGSSHARPVDAPRAREALKTALGHWKNGDDPKSLTSSGTPMVAHDYEWDSGAKLVDYQVVDDKKEEDANLRVQVKLTLSYPGKDKGKPVEKKAWYVVGTSPSVTVYRDVMRR